MSDENETLPVLRREAILVHQERGRIATLVAVCSLLGVALGFSLSTMAAAMQAASANGYHRTPVMIAPSEDGSWAWLGVTIVDAPGCKGAAVGAKVTRVHDRSPAASIGIRTDDVVVAVNDVPIRYASELESLIRGLLPDTDVVVTVVRKGMQLELETTLGHMPRHIAAAQGLR